MWLQWFLKSVEVIMGSKMLICDIADCCPVCSPVIQQFLFPSSSFSPSSKKYDYLTVLAALQVWIWKQIIMVLWPSRLWSLRQRFHSSCLFSYCHDVSWYKLFTGDSLCFVRISSPCWFSYSSFQIPSKEPNSYNSLL